MTIRQNTLSDVGTYDLNALKTFDHPKPQSRHHSSKKRKSESKKSERKSDRKSKNKSLLTHNTKTLRQDQFRPTHGYNNSMATFVNPVGSSLHTTQTLIKNPVYSTTGSHNLSSHSTNYIASKNMKSQLSKKMIKNFVNTHRENENLITKIDFEKERTLSTEKKFGPTRKACSKEKIDKRPKSSVDKSATNVPNTGQGEGINSYRALKQKYKRVPATYQSPNGVSEEPRQNKTKVKVYKLEKDQITDKSEDRNAKHLKSKSQSNFNANSVIEPKAKKIKNFKTKKNDIYTHNFSSTQYYKNKKMQENLKSASPAPEAQKSPMRTVSNFSQMKKMVGKVQKELKPQSTQKTSLETEIIKNNSLIAESGCSGFFGHHNRSKGKGGLLMV